MTFILAFFELDRRYGGPEEGGWWYDTGELVRIFRVYHDEERAYARARRANDLLDRLQKRKRPVSSVTYRGGRHGVYVYENYVPKHFPSQRPHYE